MSTIPATGAPIVNNAAFAAAKLAAENKIKYEKMRVMQAEQRKKLQEEARRNAVKTRELSQAKGKPGAPSVVGIVLTAWQKKDDGKSAAAAGQAGKKKKDSPANMVLIPSVTKLASSKAPGMEYTIINGKTIGIPSTCADDRKKAYEMLDEANKLAKDTTESEAALKKAKEAIKKADRVVEYVPITDGEPCTLKTFATATALGLGSMQLVQCVSVEASYSVFEGRARSELMCSTVVPLDKDAPPYLSLSSVVDLQQIPVQLPDLNNTWGPTLLFYFADYARDPEEEAMGRGCVEFKFLTNSIERGDYKIVSKKEDTPTRLKHVYNMSQKQDGSNPKYPVAGLFGVQALFIEGFPSDTTDKIVLRRAFGINDPDIYGAIMAANNVPAIIAGSVNMKDCVKVNPGANHTRDIGTIPIWGNAAHFLLRPYLLQQCPRVEMDWVCRRLKIRPDSGTTQANVWAKATDAKVRLDRYNPKNPCKLNDANIHFDEATSVRTLVGDKVINVGEFTGDLHDIMRRCDTPCEFRVMHSSPLEPEQRATLANMSTAQAEKVLSCADDAEIALKQEGSDGNGGIICIIYLVATMSADEQQQYVEADGKWRVRHEASLIAAAEAAEQAHAQAKLDAAALVDADGDAMMGDAATEQAGGDNDELMQQQTLADPDLGGPQPMITTDAAGGDDDDMAVLVPASMNPDEGYDAEAEDELRRQQQEEEQRLAALEEAMAAKKRARTAHQQQDDDNDSSAAATAAAAPNTKTRSRKTAPPPSGGGSSRKASRFE